MTQSDGRYGLAAVSLHWVIAALILFQIGYAWWYYGPLPDHTPVQTRALGVHMSIGLTILILSLARLAVRLAVRPPPLPAAMPRWERSLAKISHVLFYVLIVGIPLTGWALASLRAAPIPYWGLFNWPHLPGLGGLAGAARHRVSRPLGEVHTLILVWATVVLLVLHVAGALKNQVSGSPVLWRMVPFLPQR
jgi:cytochrome b561